MRNKTNTEKKILQQTGKVRRGKKKNKGRRILDDVDDFDVEGMLGNFDFKSMESAMNDPLDEDEKQFIRELPQEVLDLEKLPLHEKEKVLNKNMKNAKPGSFAEMHNLTDETGEQDEMMEKTEEIRNRREAAQKETKTKFEEKEFMKTKMREMKEKAVGGEIDQTKEIVFQPKRLGFTNAGWEIKAVAPGTQAAKLGVKVGWIITGVNGKRMSDNTKEISNMISKTRDHGKSTTIQFTYSPIVTIEQPFIQNIPEDLKKKIPGNQIPPEDEALAEEWMKNIPEMDPTKTKNPSGTGFNVRTLDDHSKEFYQGTGMENDDDLSKHMFMGDQLDDGDEYTVDDYMNEIPADALSEKDHKDRAMCKRFLHEGNIEGLRKTAKGGSRFTQGFLGFLYMTGAMNGIPQDIRKARIWVERAAINGDFEAQSHAGNFCFQGEGGPQDLVKARDYWAYGAKMGHTGCMIGYGQFLLNGFHEKTQIDIHTGMEWITKAAYDGHAEAAMQLAQMYMEGIHVKKDEGQGMYWFREAQRLDPEIEKMLKNSSQQMGGGE